MIETTAARTTHQPSGQSAHQLGGVRRAAGDPAGRTRGTRAATFTPRSGSPRRGPRWTALLSTCLLTATRLAAADVADPSSKAPDACFARAGRGDPTRTSRRLGDVPVRTEVVDSRRSSAPLARARWPMPSSSPPASASRTTARTATSPRSGCSVSTALHADPLRRPADVSSLAQVYGIEQIPARADRAHRGREGRRLGALRRWRGRRRRQRHLPRARARRLFEGAPTESRRPARLSTSGGYDWVSPTGRRRCDRLRAG
jgi:hypothetical protein